jgi:hypothetical protein
LIKYLVLVGTAVETKAATVAEMTAATVVETTAATEANTVVETTVQATAMSMSTQTVAVVIGLVRSDAEASKCLRLV